MARLEDLARGTTVRGLSPAGPVAILDAKWHGSDVLEVTYKDPTGRPETELLFRDREADLEVVAAGPAWSFDADGHLFRLVAEAHRIRLAHIFDPLLAVHTSLVEPLPHQITAVYEKMLPRQPLRFLLADDPGAGKTIMAGLLIKELLIRGDLQSCLVICPGNLVDQWQDELLEKFHIRFEILSRDLVERSPTGNPFVDYPLLIARLDHLARNEDLQAKIGAAEWDLVIVDEAHKMSASFYGGELRETKRRKIGRLVGDANRTRHFLLMTATPHNGKEEEFQLFLALLDTDRFEGRFRDGVHVVDPSDLMRRLVKEQLLKFDGMPLFPERRAYTISYQLSPPEAALYEAVTRYVREEMNRADRIKEAGEGRRGLIVSFALTTLQRRLASSPAAIYQSLKNRRERLERRLKEEQLRKRGQEALLEEAPDIADVTEEDLDEAEDAPEEEVTSLEEKVTEIATAARTIAELQAEIETLKDLENRALQVKLSDRDRKWEELSKVLQNRPEMFDERGRRFKLVIFTEHRATLEYLEAKIRGVLGKGRGAVVTIHGGMGREERKKMQERFLHEEDVLVLVATDAAGEGINLQRAHLMVNYDLPWNPNRIEQRFGRIHRIGQNEVCHLWNLVAGETREGAVLETLCKKLEAVSNALGGRVFDVIGKMTFGGKPLRDLLIEAIRYGDRPEVKERHRRAVEGAFDPSALADLYEERALARETMDVSRVRRLKEHLDRAEARRLQPHFIAAFFREAFAHLGGSIHEREPKRFEIRYVPGAVRSRARIVGAREVVVSKYERITFEKERIHIDGKPPAVFVAPGHPLLDSVTDLILERYRGLLRQGAILVDPTDEGDEPRVLFFLEHAIQDGRVERGGERRVVSRRMQFVEIARDGSIRTSEAAPYLDYRPLEEAERPLVAPLLGEAWLRERFEEEAVSHAIERIVPRHFAEVKKEREEAVRRTMAAVKDRLTKEIAYWDHRAEDLKAQEQAGKKPRLNSAKARARAEELAARLERRMAELEAELQLAPRPPHVFAGALIVPAGYLARARGEERPDAETFARETERVETIAMAAVLEAEARLGREPIDVSDEKRGYDIESKDPKTGRLHFLEVKGRIEGATSVTVTKNEILTALNKPDQYVLAIVSVAGERATAVRYIRRPFGKEPDFGVTSVNYKLDELLARAGEPA